jgi:hypothetical protein
MNLFSYELRLALRSIANCKQREIDEGISREYFRFASTHEDSVASMRP